MNFSKTRFSNGAAKVRIIFKLPNLFAKIFSFFISAPVFLRTLKLFSRPFFKWECKGTTFLFTCNTPSQNQPKEKLSKTSNMLNF
jgi:hypothetical protein